MKKVLQYINPIAHLGERKYPLLFPLLANIILCILSELYAYGIAKDPMAVGMYIIFLNVAFIIYFSFRIGIRGGLISCIVAVLYYWYIIDTRHYDQGQLINAVDTIIVLAVLYLFLATVIGWLKQRIDQLIENEADAKHRLETIIEQLPVGVLITDSSGKIMQRNKRIDTILGIKIPIGFTIGKDTLPKVKIDGYAINPSEAPLVKAIKTATVVKNKEYSFQHKDGSMVYIQVSSAPIQNRSKKIIAAASIIHDITALKQLEQQKDDFLSMASHELKTPITSLKLFIDLQKSQLKNGDIKKARYYNGRILAQANRLKELANDLLDVSRIETGKLHFTHELFELNELIKDTVEGLQEAASTHTIQVKEDGTIYVSGDRYRVYQVLVNLLTNAIKYSPNGKKIIVDVKKHKKEAIVSVQDFGIGIDPKQQKKIFDKLYQVTDVEEKTYPGLGLGLFIAKEIIEHHKGTIWVESQKGKGSTFFFSLPIAAKLKR